MAGISSRADACPASARACVHGGAAGPASQLLAPNVVRGLLPQLTLRVPVVGARARWGVDDVYVDPLRPR